MSSRGDIKKKRSSRGRERVQQNQFSPLSVMILLTQSGERSMATKGVGKKKKKFNVCNFTEKNEKQPQLRQLEVAAD